MLKKPGFLFIILLTFLWSCATFKPIPPSLYIETLPILTVAELTLEERIAIEEAWNFLKQGYIEKAERAIVRMGEQNPFYLVGLGYTSLASDNYDLARAYFERALTTEPNMTLVYLGLAQMYQKREEETLAFNALAEVIKRDPENRWAKGQHESLRVKITEELLDEARNYLSAGNTEKSKESYLKALHYSPKSKEAHLALTRIFRGEKDFKTATFHLNSILQDDPSNTELLKEYGKTLAEAGQNAKSLDVFEQVLEIDPEDREARAQVETLKNRLGVFELPSQYDAIPSSSAINKEDAAALLAVTFKDFLTEGTAKPPIIIDIATSWASRFILKLTSLGIMDVYSNHTFQPKKVITRAEMAESLVRLVGLLERKGHRIIQQFPPERIQIADVSPDNYYYLPITRIVSYQIMDLSIDKTFEPERSLSGQEALQIVRTLLNLIK